MEVLRGFLIAIFIIINVLMIIVILLQRSKGSGLASAFGGMGSESAFGVQTADSLAKFTRYLAIAFFVLALSLTWLRPKSVMSGAALIEKKEAVKEAPALPKPEAENVSKDSGIQDKGPQKGHNVNDKTPPP